MTDQLTETEKAVDGVLEQLLALVHASGGSLVCKIQIPGERMLKAWGGSVHICLGLAETLVEECRARIGADGGEAVPNNPEP